MNVTGVGAVSCLGLGARRLFEDARQGRSGLRDGIGAVDDSFLRDAPPAARDNRALAMAWLAAREAMDQSGWEAFRDDDLVILATTTGETRMWERVFLDRARGSADLQSFQTQFTHQPLHHLAQSLSLHLGHRGPAWVVSSACSAGTQALGLATMWLQQKRARRVLVGGVEILCDLTLEGFRSLQLLAPASCRPFDVHRQGINLSEGAGFLCLEAESERPLARIRGYGFSTDGHHMTGPHPEGEGIFRAMRTALEGSGLSPADITWVHAHGTGSQQNDLAESLAIERLFGVEQGPWVSSTKALHGHALGASGALETALLVESMRNGVVLPTLGLQDPDPKLRVRHPGQAIATRVSAVLKNTLGFGGNNAALVLTAGDA